MPPPEIPTDRLLLNAFRVDDAPRIEELAGDPEIAKGVVGIPHPYPSGAARNWVLSLDEAHESRIAARWAVRLKKGNLLVGCVTLFLAKKHHRAEIAFWIGRAHWRQGIATEAASAVIRYAFDKLDLHRIDGGHFTSNHASAAVLKKLGMTKEGLRRGHLFRGGVFEDVVIYGLMRSASLPQQRERPDESMEPSDSDRVVLQRLEEELWSEATRFDRKRMEEILSSDFFEIGRSGGVWRREECLAVPRQPIRAVFPLPDFQVRLLRPDVALVSYSSAVTYDGNVEHARRSSVWTRTPSGWQLRFHQGTPYQKKAEP